MRNDKTMSQKQIETLEAKFLKKYWHFLKFVEDEIIAGFNTINDIKSDWFGKDVKAKVKINSEDKVNDFIDWFGKDVEFEKKDNEIIATLKVNEESLIFEALQYGRYVEILSPVETRNKIIKIIDDMKNQYHS